MQIAKAFSSKLLCDFSKHLMYNVLMFLYISLYILKLNTPFLQVSGALIISSLVQIFLGISGLVGILMQFIGPMTIAPTIAMIGLSLFDVASGKAEGHWWIALM